MIKSWQHKGLKDYFETGSKAGIQPAHARVLSYILSQLDNATKPEDMNTPGRDFHALKGGFKGRYSVKVNANWRITFKFEKTDIILVDYIDYH